MKKFDFSKKEFGNIDPKYIEEAEQEWSEKRENWRPKEGGAKQLLCVIVTLGSVIFSNPHIQASIKNITLSTRMYYGQNDKIYKGIALTQIIIP